MRDVAGVSGGRVISPSERERLTGADDDLFDVEVDVSQEWVISDSGALDAAVELSHSWLEFEGYERKFDLVADWYNAWSTDWQTRVRADLGLVDAVDDASSDGTKTGLRVRGYRSLGRDTAFRRVRLQAALRQDDRDDAFDGYDSSLIGVECRFSLPHDISLDVGLDFESREYGAVDPFFETTRDDDIVDLSAYLMKPLGSTRFAEAGRGEVSMSEHDSGAGSGRKGFMRDMIERITPAGTRSGD